MQASVVVVAAGNSSRMNGVNKQELLLGGKPVLIHTLQAFEKIPQISEMILVTRKDAVTTVRKAIQAFGVTKVKAILPGGATRQESVRIGLQSVSEEKVLIHDGARPFVTTAVITEVLQTLRSCDAAVPGVPLKDTVKQISVDGTVVRTVSREELAAVQTPQGFTTSVIIAAHQKAEEDGFCVTDDASVAEYLGVKVCITKGDYYNIKITTPEDILLSTAIYAKKQEEEG